MSMLILLSALGRHNVRQRTRLQRAHLLHSRCWFRRNLLTRRACGKPRCAENMLGCTSLVGPTGCWQQWCQRVRQNTHVWRTCMGDIAVVDDCALASSPNNDALRICGQA